MSFTKGMPHCPDTGLLIDPLNFEKFVSAIDSGDPRDFQDVELGPTDCVEGDCRWLSTKARQAQKNRGSEPNVRAWESQGAGNTFDLEGPDAQAVTMPPAPALGSDELTAEMGEVYVQALLRDTPFAAMSFGTSTAHASGNHRKAVTRQVDSLNALAWFSDHDNRTAEEQSRQRGTFTPETAFRGITRGDNTGPYISQFLLAGNTGLAGQTDRNRSAGLISYGSIRIDQKVRTATATDYMTTWKQWLDVQNGANLGGLEQYEGNEYRFITTPRDLATYVHYDALYEAYLNACLIMLGEGIPFDRGIPFQDADFRDKQQGFAHFGGPHILSLVTEVATRALKAVRFQKFNIHRRCRPEVLAARLHRVDVLESGAPQLRTMANDLKPIIDAVRKHNASDGRKGTALLPMAFCEGSPMHPAYGAGHATVAGACVTILKAFFDHDHPLALAADDNASIAFVPTKDGRKLDCVDVFEPAPGTKSGKTKASLTVEGELNKLASNISIGRDWAGVHYFTDYIESIRMGEQIAIGILEEQKLTYGENFSMTVPLFDGGTVRI